MKRILTTASQVMRESSVRTIPARNPEMKLVKAYPNMTRQPIVGFGAALTEAAGYTFARMSPSLQERFLDECFGPAGNRYSLCRISIQSCDFSLAPRPYLSQRDVTLANFSIDDDWGYVLPLVKAAQRRNPDVQFLASPWSPPAWAKTNRNMKFGGHLERSAYGIWARMIAQTVADYRREGVPITRVTVQNEPQARQIWESCLFSAQEEGLFLAEYLKPALRAQGLDDVKTLIWDHNKERMLDRTLAITANPTWDAQVDGVAFHWYSGDHFDALRETRAVVGPQRELIFTEGCDFYSKGDSYWELPHAEHYAHEIVGDLNAGANGVIDWNILLDSAGGPNHVGNYCDAPLMYDPDDNRLHIRLPFFYIRHFSRYIQPGALNMLVTSYTTELEACGAVNPDSSCIAVVLNRGNNDVDFDFTWYSDQRTSRIAHLKAPAHSIQTLLW